MPYTIVLEREPWDKFWAYVHECKDEVAAFGYIKPDYDTDLLVVDELFLVPQEVCGTEVDFVSDGLPYAVNKAVAEGRIEDLRFCVHSHVNMGTGFSSTDDNMVAKMGESGTPWFASAIFNKKGDTNGRVDIFAPALPLPGCDQLTVDADVTTYKAISNRDEAKDELAEFVKKQVKVVPPTKGGSKHWSQQAWQTPMNPSGAGIGDKDTHSEPKSLLPGKPIDQPEWYDTDELEQELATWITAKREGWIEVEDNDGRMHFYTEDGHWKASAEVLDEDTVEWFHNKRLEDA